MGPGAPYFIREGEVVAGKYAIERTLGRGGMGVVVAAQHLQLRQRVAIKFLLPCSAPAPDTIPRFLREAQAVARIQSERVARVLDVATLSDGTPYIVMEFLEGRDLAQLLALRGPMPLEEAVGYLLQACEGVAAAHAAGIIHRDLKPANLFVCDRGGVRGVVKVLDFGISKSPDSAVTSSDAALTKTSTVMGSPLYMSPEQMSSAKHVDVRTDVWSLGVSLFELLTCKTPFTGDSMTELIAAVLQREPLSISSVRADLPPDLVRAVAGALEKDREKRYPSVAAFAAAIAPFGPRHSEVSVERISDMLGRAPAPWAQGALPAAGGIAYEKTAAASSGAVAASSTGAGTTGQPVSSDRKGERAPRRRSFVAMVGGLGLVAVLGLGGALLLQRHARGVTPEPVAAAVPAQTASSPRVVAPVAAEPLRPSGSVTSDDSSNSAPPSAAAPPSAVHRQAPPPAVAPAPIGTAAKSATAPPASEPACKVVQYFDSDGEIRFKKECH